MKEKIDLMLLKDKNGQNKINGNDLLNFENLKFL